MELRSAMETLQIKLGEAERKLQQKNEKKMESDENQVKDIVNRLSREEDQLRRDQCTMNASLSEKESMVLMQQHKCAALDEANVKLVQELNKVGEKVNETGMPSLGQAGLPRRKSSVSEENTPKTVDELLDSLHSTPI